jgi:hypothetical protein
MGGCVVWPAYPAGGPSDAAEDLTAPTPPAPQSLASTATTASVTWTHAGAPGGTTYALTVVDDEDDEIAPDSGTGLGPWVVPVVSGRSYSATLTATGPDGQTSQSSALVAVAATGGASWTRTTVDLTDLDVATLSAGSTTAVTRATVEVADIKVVNYSANNGAVTAGASGITISGGGAAGSMTIGTDLVAMFGLTLPDDIITDAIIHLHLTGLADWTGSSDAWEAGLMNDTSANFTTGSGFSVRGNYDAAGQDRLASTNSATTNWALNEATPAGAWIVSILLRGGNVAEAVYTLGSTLPTPADVLTDAVPLGRTVAALGTRWAATTLWASVRAIWRPNLTLTAITLETRA